MRKLRSRSWVGLRVWYIEVEKVVEGRGEMVPGASDLGVLWENRVESR